MRLRIIFALGFLASSLFSAGLIPVPGRTGNPTPNCNVVCYYVDGVNGSDSNSGLTPQSAFATLDMASGLVVPGATVYVLSGTYSAFDSNLATLSITTAGAPNAWISFVAYPGNKPQIAIFPHSWDGIHVLGAAAYVLIDGFEIVGNRKSVNPQMAFQDHGNDGLYNEAGIYVEGSNHVTIRNCNIHDTSGGGIGTNTSDYVTIAYNTTARTAFWSAYAESGISLYHSVDIDNATTYKNYIVGNVAYGNREYVPNYFYSPPTVTDGNAIIVDDNLHSQDTNIPYNGRTYVANNVIFKNGGRGVHVNFSQHVDAANNSTYSDMLSPAITFGELDAFSSNDVNIVNSIGYAPAGKQVNSVSGNTNVTYNYNIYFGTTHIPARGPNDLVADPQFVNPSAGNLRMQPTSPAIGSGTDSLAPAIDITGKARMPGAIDRGAFAH